MVEMVGRKIDKVFNLRQRLSPKKLSETKSPLESTLDCVLCEDKQPVAGNWLSAHNKVMRMRTETTMTYLPIYSILYWRVCVCMYVPIVSIE